MHFWISLGTLTGFILVSGVLGWLGGLFTHAALSRPARKG